MTTAAEAWHVGQERGVRWRGVIWAGHAAMMPVWPGVISCALSTMLLLPPHLLAASKFFAVCWEHASRYVVPFTATSSSNSMCNTSLVALQHDMLCRVLKAC